MKFYLKPETITENANPKLTKNICILKTYMKYPNIHNIQNILDTLGICTKRETHRSKKSNRYFSLIWDPNMNFVLVSVCFLNPDKILMPKRELHKSVRTKSQINEFINYIILNKFSYSI